MRRLGLDLGDSSKDEVSNVFGTSLSVGDIPVVFRALDGEPRQVGRGCTGARLNLAQTSGAKCTAEIGADLGFIASGLDGFLVDNFECFHNRWFVSSPPRSSEAHL